MLTRRSFLGTVAAVAVSPVAAKAVPVAAAPTLPVDASPLAFLRALGDMSSPRRLGVITFIEEPRCDDGDTILELR